MKVVLLLAGRGRRLGYITDKQNKSLIKLLNKPLLGHLIDGFLFNNLNEIIPILGYDSQGIMNYLNEYYGKDLKLTPVFNQKYEETNNMYSFWCARELLDGKAFILCNGDLILNKFIIKKIMNAHQESAIMVDILNKSTDIDSPGTIVSNGRILDLGRHIPKENNGGYAIGLYKFGSMLSSAYFREVKKMLAENQYQAGFHDPLITLLKSYVVSNISTDGLSWIDIDVKEDIPKAKGVLRNILVEENNVD